MFRFWEGYKSRQQQECFAMRKELSFLHAWKLSGWKPNRNFFLLCIRSDRPCRTSLINSESTSSSSAWAVKVTLLNRLHQHCISKRKSWEEPQQTNWKRRGKVRDENKLRQRIKHRYELVSIVLTTLAPRPRNWLLGKFYCSHYRFIVIERGMERIPLRPAQSPSSAKVEIIALSWEKLPAKASEDNHCKRAATMRSEMLQARRLNGVGEAKGLFLKDFRRHQFSHGGARSWEFSWPFFPSEFSDFH